MIKASQKLFLMSLAFYDVQLTKIIFSAKISKTTIIKLDFKSFINFGSIY